MAEEKTRAKEEEIQMVESEDVPQTDESLAKSDPEAFIETIEQQSIIIQKSNQEALMSLHENFNNLLQKGKEVSITDESTEEEYEEGMTVWREIKGTHIAFKKRMDQIKRPVLDITQDLNRLEKEIYKPLFEEAKRVREQTKIYENKVEAEKKKKKEAEEKKKREEEALEQKLKDLQSNLSKVNECATQEDVEALKEELNGIDIKEYGDRSNDASFIITNLTKTCDMVKKGLPSKADLEKEKESPKEESPAPEKSQESTSKEGKEEKQAPFKSETSFGSMPSPDKSRLAKAKEIANQNQAQPKEEPKQTATKELVSDNKAKPGTYTPKEIFTKEMYMNIITNKKESTFPAVLKNKAGYVMKVLTVNNVQSENGVPVGLDVKVHYPDGTNRKYKYQLIKS